MNIFYLHPDPKVAAEMACDKHCSKMIVESGQMESTAHRVLDGVEYYDKTANGRKIKRWRMADKYLESELYKAGHINHPSTLWVMSSVENYMWLYEHMLALNEEFKKRYGHKEDHMTIQKLKTVLKTPPKNISHETKFTPPPPAMPDYCKVTGDSVASYRKYYILEKRRFATWKSPSVVPEWYLEGVRDYQQRAET